MLERYALGELPPDERAEVDRVLAHDPIARDCLASIQVDMRTMPPLPTITKVSAKQPWWREITAWRLGLVTTTALGIAAALLLPRPVIVDQEGAKGMQGAKGDDVSLSLVRERSGAIALDPTTFASGDRLKVRVTCATAETRVAQVAVLQDGDVSFPLEPQTIHCGNLVVLAGAFHVDATGPADVCVFVGTNSAEVTHALSSRLASHPQMDCVTLAPEMK